ncbi:FAD-binding protein [Polymorphobacter sp. PAMC 29334]|uniref:FAD-binding protein n=1 Tax=Polymorphobacter sp. PAMC 29334 TaxID=2862331 RepID=UPI001C743799|nr:FAD-binding protein [Polymorphobacter sp. PAMC 29334]QYE34904.1 FAD-binding protein [Polymorphobacter sp. PAMC 29334]
MTTIHADTADAVAEAVREAYAAGRSLEVVGTGSRRGYGRPVDADAVLDVSGLSGIVDYDPAELVLTARPGTPITEITALVAGHGQHLAFDPPDLAPLWGGEPGAGTLGGLLGLGLGGSRRVSAGAPRDHFLGFAAVNGRGENFSAGGKVIKNVTGYDLPKLLAGSLGTLAVLTEVTIKILPAPRAATTLTWFGLDDRAAITAMTRALNSPLVLQAAAHVPAGCGACADRVRAATRLHLAGVPVAVAANARNLTDLLGDFGVPEAIHDVAAIWRDIGGIERFTKPGEIVWRVVLPPSTAAAFTAALAPGNARWFYDWGGGLVWVILPDAADGHAAMVRGALAATAGADGHATLVRAPDAVRCAVAPFQPLAPTLAALSDRVRQRFDPGGVLNPGRIWATS